MTKTNAKSSRWIIEIRGKDHDEVVAELKLVVEYIEELYEVSASMDREIDFSKAKRVKPSRRPVISKLLEAVDRVVFNWDGGDLAGSINHLVDVADKVKKLYR